MTYEKIKNSANELIVEVTSKVPTPTSVEACSPQVVIRHAVNSGWIKEDEVDACTGPSMNNKQGQFKLTYMVLKKKKLKKNPDVSTIKAKTTRKNVKNETKPWKKKPY